MVRVVVVGMTVAGREATVVGEVGAMEAATLRAGARAPTQSAIVTRATTIAVLHLMVARARHKDPTTVAVVQADATHVSHRSTTAGAPLPRAASSEMYAATMVPFTSTTESFRDVRIMPVISLNVGPQMEAEEVVNRG
jgi:hypothetical protein